MPGIPIQKIQEFNSMQDRPSRLSKPAPSLIQKQTMWDQFATVDKAQEAERQRIKDKESNILKGVWDYLKYNTAPGAIITGLNENFRTPDPNFDPYHFDNFRPKNDWENNQISQAVNPMQYSLIKKRLLEHRDYEDNLKSMGYGKFGIVIAGELMNPLNYILPGTEAIKEMQGIKKVAAAGVLQMGINTVDTGIIDSVYNNKTPAEYLSTAAMGLGFGAIFGAILPTKGVSKVAEVDKVIKDKAKFYADLHMKNTAAESAENIESVGAAGLQADRKILDPKMEERLRNEHIDPNDPLAVQATIDAANGELKKQKPLVGKTLGSQGFTTQTSDNILMRKIGADLVEKPESKISEGIDKQTAALEVAMETERLASIYAKRTDNLYRAFQGVEPEYRGINTWNDLAFERLHRGEDLDRLSKDGNRLLQEWGENRNAVWQEVVQKGHAAGVEELQNLEDALNYVTRPYDPANIHKLTGIHGEDTMIRLFQKGLLGDGGFKKIYQQYVDQAIKKAEAAGEDESKWQKFTNGDINVDDISYQMAKQTIARMMKRATSPTHDANLLNTGNQTLMRKIITDSDMDPEIKDALFHILKTQGRDRVNKLGATRMHIDMGAEINSPVTGETLRMTDFFNTDTGAGQFQHMRYWLGRTAMANQGPQYKSIEAIIRNRDSIKFHGDAVGMSAKDVSRDLETYDNIVSQLLSQPLEELGSKAIRRSRQIRKMVQLNVLNKIGVPQLGESGRALSAVGNVIHGIPVLGKLLTDIKANRLSPEIVKNFEDNLFGRIGDDYITGASWFRGEDLGTKAGKLETALNKIGYAQNILSGWHFIETAQRKFLINGLSQKYFEEITQGTMTRAVMNDLGLTDEMLSKIKSNMLEHATDVEKKWGRHIPKNLHIEKWSPDVAKVFGQAVYRKSSNAIQRILIGETPEFMTKEVGKVLTQFRAFNIASIGKQFRRDIQLAKAGEKEPYNAMMFQFTTAALATMLKIGWDATTSGDYNKYSKKHFTVQEIARQALQYNGQIGWGVDVVDNAGAIAFPDAWNPLMSTQGYISHGGIERLVPGLDYLNKVKKGLKGTANIITGTSKNTAADARAALGWLPLENSIAADILLKPIQK